MNAPANIAMPAATEPAGWSDAEYAYRRTISIHCPNCNDMEMAYRVQLAMIRDNAMAGATRATDSAAVILGEVCRLATASVFAPAPLSHLIRLRGTLNLTMDAARAVERVCRDG